MVRVSVFACLRSHSSKSGNGLMSNPCDCFTGFFCLVVVIGVCSCRFKEYISIDVSALPAKFVFYRFYVAMRYSSGLTRSAFAVIAPRHRRQARHAARGSRASLVQARSAGGLVSNASPARRLLAGLAWL